VWWIVVFCISLLCARARRRRHGYSAAYYYYYRCPRRRRYYRRCGRYITHYTRLVLFYDYIVHTVEYFFCTLSRDRVRAHTHTHTHTIHLCIITHVPTTGTRYVCMCTSVKRARRVLIRFEKLFICSRRIFRIRRVRVRTTHVYSCALCVYRHNTYARLIHGSVIGAHGAGFRNVEGPGPVSGGGHIFRLRISDIIGTLRVHSMYDDIIRFTVK